jgi:hypothetical protein
MPSIRPIGWNYTRNRPGGGVMWRRRNHHPQKTPRRGDLHKWSTPMQRNLDILPCRVQSVLSLFNILFPLPPTSLLGCLNWNNYGCLKPILEARINSLTEGNFLIVECNPLGSQGTNHSPKGVKTTNP